MTKRPTLGAALLLLSLSVATLLSPKELHHPVRNQKRPSPAKTGTVCSPRERSYSSSAVPSAMTSAEISL